jgi:hypothetical protein
MASMISKRPVAGIGAGIFFGALGLLIIQTESATGSIKGVLRIFYTVVGYFLLCVAALSIILSVFSFLKTRASWNERDNPIDSQKD